MRGRFLAAAAPFLLAIALFLPAQSASAAPYPYRGTRAEQWKYITVVAAEGFAIKAKEAGLTGPQRQQAFRRRTERFFTAALRLRDYLKQHFDTESKLNSADHVYARFTGGLYWENAADYWKASTWYQLADRHRQKLGAAGLSNPKYNGVPVARLLPARLYKSRQAACLAASCEHPVKFSLNIFFTPADEHRAAANFALARQKELEAIFTPGDEIAADEAGKNSEKQ